MRKIIAVIFSLVLVLGLTGCGEKVSDNTQKEEKQVSPTKEVSFYDVEFKIPKEWEKVKGKNVTDVYYKDYDEAGKVKTMLFCSFFEGPVDKAIFDNYLYGIENARDISNFSSEDADADGVTSKVFMWNQDIEGETFQVAGLSIPLDSGIHSLFFYSSVDDYDPYYEILNTLTVY